MAGKNKHLRRIQALHEYGQMHPNVNLDFGEIMIFINTYTNDRGRLHRFVNTNSQVIGNLLLKIPEYQRIKSKCWRYNKNKEEE